MRPRDMPRVARTILDDGELCYVAAPTRFGPHLTPVVYAFDGGRLWLTTARSSAKARAWKTDPRVAGMIRVGDLALTFRGTVRTFDALDPFTWPSAAISSPRLGKAATRFSMKNARFFFGYVVDAYRVPLAWAPPGRVFTSVDLEAARILDLAEGTVVDGWGGWLRGLEVGSAFAADPSDAVGQSLEDRLPEELSRALGGAGDGAFATYGPVAQGSPLTVVPVSWHRSGGTYEVRLPVTFAELTRSAPGTPAALTIDRASAWRAAEMRGLLLRGSAEAFVLGATKRGAAALRGRIGDGEALIRLALDRAVWWQGWASGTIVRDGPASEAKPKRAPQPKPDTKPKSKPEPKSKQEPMSTQRAKKPGHTQRPGRGAGAGPAAEQAG
jgi:Pyridoxamine 5'-phosphate oxidase